METFNFTDVNIPFYLEDAAHANEKEELKEKLLSSPYPQTVYASC